MINLLVCSTRIRWHRYPLLFIFGLQLNVIEFWFWDENLTKQATFFKSGTETLIECAHIGFSTWIPTQIRKIHFFRKIYKAKSMKYRRFFFCQKLDLEEIFLANRMTWGMIVRLRLCTPFYKNAVYIVVSPGRLRKNFSKIFSARKPCYLHIWSHCL